MFDESSDALLALPAQPPDEAINLERRQFSTVVTKCRRQSLGMRQPTLHMRKPLPGYAAVIALQLNAKVTSAIQRSSHQGATGAGEGIEDELPRLRESFDEGVRIFTAFCVG